MKALFKKTLTVLLIASVLVQTVITVNASAAGTTGTKAVITSSGLNSLDEKSKELAKNLAEKGIKKAIGKIPVIGGTVNSIVSPYIKDLLGIKEGESTGAKLDKMNEKLDSLLETVKGNSQNEMKKIYESKFDDFNDRLLSVKTKTREYLIEISKYEKENAVEEEVNEEEVKEGEVKEGEEAKEEVNEEEVNEKKEKEKTLLIAGLTENSNDEFITYLDNITILSQYVTGEVVQLYQEGDIYTKAYNVFCYDIWHENGCALGGEAAMMNSEYVNAINEIVDSAQTTAAIMLLARCYVGDNIEDYRNLQSNGEITSDISLIKFNKTDSDRYKTKYNILKGLHYDIFGVTEEDAANEKALKNTVAVDPGVVGRYNQMIEDRWFDYIEDVNFSENVPVVKFIEIDGEIGFASLQDCGFDKNRAMALSEDSAVSYCKSISNKVLAGKHAALSEEQFNNLLKHIETSENFKYEKEFEGADYKKISLRDALIKYGFSFADFDSSGYNSPDYSKIFVTNAKCIEDYDNTYGDQPTHDGYIDGFVYGIDYNTITENMNSKSAETAHQYFKGSYSDHRADKKSTDFPEFAMLYFQNTTTINSTSEFKKFITKIASGDNYACKTVVLNCDVDLSQTDYLNLWPDAKRKNEFCGTFDGNGHTIKNFHISAGEHRLALFRTTGEGAVIKNLTFENIKIECTANMCGCAAVAGYANGNLTVDYVMVDSGSITGYKYVGGIVGETKEGKYSTTTISNCRNYADITSEDVDAGGFIANAAATVLVNSYNGGNITAKKGAAGGLAGYIGNKDTDPNVFVENCYNTGTIVGYDCAGGICGHIESDNLDTIVARSENTGDITVTAKRSAGGIVGRTCSGGVFSNNKNSGNVENQSTNEDAEAGGILGENEDDAITMSENENTGNITANKRAGGIAGTLGDRDHDKACNISNNNNSGTITSKAKDAGGIVGAVATDNTSHTIVQNTNTGIIEAKKEAGGIVGWMAGGGSFDSNKNSANITSIDLNAGGIVGRIQDDKCDFRKSSLGNAYAGIGSLTPGQLAGCDYYINAMNTDQHAGMICGWDGKRGKTITNDNLLASIFDNGNIVVIVSMSVILISAAIVFVVVYKRKRKTVK